MDNFAINNSAGNNLAACGALGAYANVAQTAGIQTPKPVQADTLVRALSSLDELNKRLEAMREGSYQIASAIGGPYPVSAPKGEQIDSSSAMSRLNRGIDDAHRTLNELDEALAAIRRSLGA